MESSVARTEKQRQVSRDTLQARFCRAIVEHFLDHENGDVDAGDIVVASGAILSAYLQAMRPEHREDAVNKIVSYLRREVLGGGHA